MRFVYGSRVYTLYFQLSTGCPVASPQRDGAVDNVGMTYSCHVRENRVSGTSVVSPDTALACVVAF